MGEHYKEREILIRLTKLEKELQIKNDRISKLEHGFRKELEVLERSLRDEIRQRDGVIASLKSKIQENMIAGLQSKLQEAPTTYADAVAADAVTKNEHDLLVIGDSIVRFVDGEKINPGGDTSVKCIPGARPDTIISECKELLKTNSFKRIVVHTGTNLIPRYSRTFVSDKIVECLEALKQLTPKSRITFSAILPKYDDTFLAGINEVNSRVERSGRFVGFGCINHCRAMTHPDGSVNARLFNNDAVHLSPRGVEALQNSLRLISAR